MPSKAVAGAGVAGVTLAVWLLIVVLRHGGEEVYDLPGHGVALGVAGAVAAAAGWALVAWRRDGLVLGITAAGLLLVLGVASIFSVGIGLLVAFLVSVVVLVRAARRRQRGVPLATAVTAAALVGLGLPLAAIVAADGPVVRCHRNGVETSSNVFRAASGSSGSSRSTTGGADASRTEGEATVGDRHYRYVCEGDRLVEFEATDR